jgi:hypothetical protein
MKYEKPRLTSLNPRAGSGQCTTGTGDAGGCQDGAAATDPDIGCNNGTGPDLHCWTGDVASATCSAGDALGL